MKSKILSHSIVLFVAVSLSGAGLASAATVITESGTHSGGGIFTFPNVPSNSSNDQANGLTFSVIQGAFSGSVANLTNGVTQTSQDSPSQSFFFGDGVSGRIQVDLGSSLSISQINTYSWHTGARTPQNYKVYGAMTVPVSGPTFGTAAFQNSAALALLGYTEITTVSNGSRGVSISNIGADYRYILFDMAQTGGGFGTFYGEIDIHAIPELSSGVLGLVGSLLLLRRSRRG